VTNIYLYMVGFLSKVVEDKLISKTRLYNIHWFMMKLAYRRVVIVCRVKL
jgi:hypothetical protein